MRLETNFVATKKVNGTHGHISVDVYYAINEMSDHIIALKPSKIGKCIEVANEAFKKEWANET